MLTIEHCEHLHLQVNPETQRAIAGAIAKALSPIQASGQPPALGEIWPGQGGRYAGTMPARDGKPGWHLVLAEKQAEKITWGPYDDDVTGVKDHHDGLANTQALLARGSNKHPAAWWCEDLQVDEHQDFYLPSHNELMLMWVHVPHLFSQQGWYWSSTQYSPTDAWAQAFEDGHSSFDTKDRELRAVAVRRLVL